MTPRTVIITGAAAGIGRATTKTLASRGWTVGALDRDAEALATLAEETARDGLDVRTATLDVTDADEFAARVGEVVEATGRLDALINNAGLLRAGRFEDIDVEVHRQEIDVNVVGVLNGCHAGFEHLRRTAGQHGTATVVNLGSASAIYGQAELASYSATKFYVRGLTEALDIEWAHHGIRVVDLWPLFVGTGMLDGVSIGTTTSLGVKLQAQDVADSIVTVLDPSRRARVLRQVHFPVGGQSKAMALGSRFSPAWLTRGVNRKLAGH